MNRNQRFKSARQELSLTQSEFAKKLDVTASYISDIENERRSVTDKFIKKMREKLNISTEWMYTEKGSIIINDTHLTTEKSTQSDELSMELDEKIIALGMGNALKYLNTPERKLSFIESAEEAKRKSDRIGTWGDRYKKTNPEAIDLIKAVDILSDLKETILDATCFYFNDLSNEDKSSNVIWNGFKPTPPLENYKQYKDKLDKEANLYRNHKALLSDLLDASQKLTQVIIKSPIYQNLDEDEQEDFDYILEEMQSLQGKLKK